MTSALSPTQPAEIALTETAERVIDIREPASIPPGPRVPLGRDFARLWSATAISSLGDGIRIATLPLLATTLTRDPLLISGVLFASMLPWLLFTLLAGAIADRVDRRTLVTRVNLGRALVMGAFCAALFLGWAELYVLYALAFIQGVGEVFSDNTAFALLPRVVPKERLEDANGRLEAAVVALNLFAGPALGGALFAASLGLPFALDALSFALAALLFSRVKVRTVVREPQAQRSRIRQDIKEGLRYLWANKLLRTLSLTGATTNLVLNATFAIFVLFALDVLDLGPLGFGIVMSVEGIGAVGGSLLAARIQRHLGLATSIVIALGAAGAANLVIGTSSHVAVVALMAVAISFAGGIWNVLTNSVRQKTVPDHLLGRVQSAHRFLSWGAIPLGTALGGLLVHSFGLRAPFIMAGVVLLGAASILAAGRVRAAALEPIVNQSDPELAIAL